MLLGTGMSSARASSSAEGIVIRFSVGTTAFVAVPLAEGSGKFNPCFSVGKNCCEAAILAVRSLFGGLATLTRSSSWVPAASTAEQVCGIARISGERSPQENVYRVCAQESPPVMVSMNKRCRLTEAVEGSGFEIKRCRTALMSF